MAKEELLGITKLEENEVFEYPQVIKHTHNGIDSEKIDANNLKNLDVSSDIAAYLSDTANVEVVASDVLVDSADTEKTIPAKTMSYTKYKDITYNEIDGTIRVYWESKNPNSYFNNVYLKIYVNGVAAGTEVNEGNDVYTSHTEDISVSTGDSVQLYAEALADADDAIGNIKNFRLKYSKQLKTTVGTVVTN